ncbi:hypothetical protein [Endozoicomonas ascidiicola]|uniref:hypothetical protein n=1 Tax=Endozoicomonas ascidiicola TaxID=1698521 RepID=UPI0008365D07|nr:hypothetical protein [Endozoicomonas ascidiicola]
MFSLNPTTSTSTIPYDLKLSGDNPESLHKPKIISGDRDSTHSLTSISEYNISNQPTTSSIMKPITQESLSDCLQTLFLTDNRDELSQLMAKADADVLNNWLNSPLEYSEKHDTPVIYAARRLSDLKVKTGDGPQ